MKNLIVALILVIFLFSCRQDALRVTGNDSEISFDVSGSHYAHIGDQTAANGSIGVFATKLKGIPGGLNTLYSFAGYANNTNTIQLIIQMSPADTLKVINYHITSGGGTLTVNNQVHSFINSSDYLDITITSYQNGIVDGRFAGVLTKIISISPNVTQPATITNGVIKNVQIHY